MFACAFRRLYFGFAMLRFSLGWLFLLGCFALAAVWWCLLLVFAGFSAGFFACVGALLRDLCGSLGFMFISDCLGSDLSSLLARVVLLLLESRGHIELFVILRCLVSCSDNAPAVEFRSCAGRSTAICTVGPILGLYLILPWAPLTLVCSSAAAPGRWRGPGFCGRFFCSACSLPCVGVAFGACSYNSLLSRCSRPLVPTAVVIFLPLCLLYPFSRMIDPYPDFSPLYIFACLSLCACGAEWPPAGRSSPRLFFSGIWVPGSTHLQVTKLWFVCAYSLSFRVSYWASFPMGSLPRRMRLILLFCSVPFRYTSITAFTCSRAVVFSPRYLPARQGFTLATQHQVLITSVSASHLRFLWILLFPLADFFESLAAPHSFSFLYHSPSFRIPGGSPG